MSDEFNEVDQMKAHLAHQRGLVEQQIESCYEALRKQDEMEGWEGWPQEIAGPIRAETEQQLAVAQEALSRVEMLEEIVEGYS